VKGARVAKPLAGGPARLGEGCARWFLVLVDCRWTKGAWDTELWAKRDAGSEVRVRLLLRPRGGALIGGATRSGKQGALRGGKKVSSCKWDRPYGGGCCACACWAGTRERNGPRGEGVSWARVEEDWASWAALLLGLGFLYPILSSFLFLSPFLFQTNSN
jgi:hypothetical protein